MNSCFENLIGVRGRCAEQGNPILYLNDLPFITIATADASINEEMQSGFDLLDKKIEFAWDETVATVHRHLSPYWRANSIIDRDSLGYYRDNLPALAGVAGYYRGWKVEFTSREHLKFYISSIRLQIATAGTVSFKIFDMLTGAEVHTFDITTTTADEIGEAQVNQGFTSVGGKLKLFIGYPSTVASYQNSIGSRWGCQGCGDWGLYKCSQSPMPIFTGGQIGTASAKTQQNFQGTGSGNGMSMTYSLQCDLGEYLCAYNNLLAWPARYKAGAEVLKETKHARRVNSVVSLHGKSVDDLIAQYEGAYTDSMNDILGNMRIPKDGCFQCNDRVRWKTQVP